MAQEVKAILREEQQPLRQQFWTLDQIAAFLTERFGIRYCTRHLRRILKAMGMYHYKPQLLDYRRSDTADVLLQPRFLWFTQVLAYSFFYIFGCP